MKKILYTLFVIVTVLFAMSVSAYAASTTEALSSSKIQEMLETSWSSKFNAPFDKDLNAKEYIDPFSGALSVSENILYFPGKNGLDLNLNCSYNSQSIKDTYFQDGTYYDNTYFRGVYYYDYINENGFTKTILILFDSEDELWENASVSFTAKELPDVRDDDNGDEYYMFSDFDIVSEGGITFTRNLEKHPIELEFSRRDKYTEAMISPERTHFSDMWDWNIPTIYETIHPTLTESVDGVKIYDLYTAFSDIDGEVRQIHFYYDVEDGDIDYVSADVRSNVYYSVYYEDPKSDTVDTERDLTYRCKIIDPQGRIMYFSYHGYIVAVEDRFGNMIRYTFDNNKLVKIVDTLGRIVTFEYTDSEAFIYVDSDGEGPNERVLYTVFSNTTENDTELDPTEHFTVDDTYTCTITRFENATEQQSTVYVYKKLHPRYIIGSSRYGEEAVSEVVSQITYPNGLQTHYTYERIKTSAGVSKKDYHVTLRYDRDNGIIYNETTYDYVMPIGAFVGSTTETVQTRSADNLTDTFTGSKYVTSKVTTFDDVSLTEEYEYDESYGKRKLELTTQFYKVGSTKSTSREINNSYDNRFRPNKIAYDDYEKTISYFDNSSFVESIVYNQSEDVYIKQSYTLSDEGDDFYTGRTVDKMTVSSSTDGGDTYSDEYTIEYTYNPDGTLASEIFDPDGINRVTTYTYTYGTDGSITTTSTVSNIKDADGNALPDITTSSKIDYLGRLIYSCDGNGNLTTYEYDDIGRLTKVTNPDDTTITYEYDTQNRTTIVTNEDGIMEKAKYDGFGNILAIYKNTGTNASPVWTAVTEYEYDAICRPVVVTEYTVFNDTTPTKWIETHYSYGAFDNVSEIATYDETGTELTKETYTFNYTDRMGSSTSAIEAHDVTNGGTSRKFTSVTVESAAKDGITPPTVKQYLDRQGRLVKQIRTDGADEYISTYIYDALGNVLEYKDESAYAEYDVDYSKKYEYNYLNKVIKEYNAEGNYTQSTYDVLGNLLTVTDYMGNTITYTYDALGRLISESAPVDDNVTSYSKYYYDANSNVISTVKAAAAGNITYTYTYDDRNRLISSFDGSTYTVNEYDGNQLVKTASGLQVSTDDISELSPLNSTYNVTDFTYDKYGNVISEYTFNGETSYTYDLAGNTLTTTDPRGATITNKYDSRGNVIKSIAAYQDISYTYNSFGLMTSADRNGYVIRYTYDNFGRNIAETMGSRVLTRGYNTSGQVTSMTFKDGETVLQSSEYEYSVLGNMTSASDGTDTVTYAYNENGLPITEEKSGLITTYEYTPGNLMKSTVNQRRRVNDPTNEEGYNDIRDVSEFVYTYHPDGNVNTVTDTRLGKIYNTTYTYDSANRLVNAQITKDGASVRSWAYIYNNRGDRISQTVTDEDGVSTATTYAYTNHRLTSETTNGVTTTYTYDACGNTVTKDNGSEYYYFSYNTRNELIAVSTPSGSFAYNYDALSRRISNGFTVYTWAGDNIIREETTDKSTDYFYGVNRVSRTVKGDEYIYDVVIDRYYDETQEDYAETVVPVNG
ncbi:MAG: RHS repeat protein, partial [Clostridia bacterium]|nr:RHS repeat protein [Clostridia bacterium]